MRETPTFSDWVVAGLVWVLFAVFRVLPLDAASNLGSWLARRIGPRIGAHRLAERNMRRALPELSDEQVSAALTGMWDNLGRVVAEYPHLGDIARDESRVEIVGGDVLDQLRDDGIGALFVSAHYGSWEMSPITTARHGFPITVVYRAANNPLVNAMVQKMRGVISQGYIPKGRGAGMSLMRALRAGTHVGLLNDQKMNEGIPIPFFGRDAMTAPAVVEFAYRLKVPLVLAKCERLGGTRFRVTYMAPMDLPDSGDRKADVKAVLRRINGEFEDWIRARPDHWFWLHRRWPD